ncbi:amidohydrolase [Terrilactibacillus sp. BCM23-1]|uniref:Amidohydrolase n=1 Tax=Terrilactibacillus tamarindi TaxID=2599694 RepID=A0A6N8CM35_9BACI|nr:amidohydrolase [Terrilactibacillus tamarindi]MTT30490.1 amidohydrolase [Terrilactibacillus tamarindi]
MLNKWHDVLDTYYDEMVEWRRHLHKYPELSFQEVKTKAFIVHCLENVGIEAKPVGGGIVGVIKGKSPGKTIALRADFDALPIQDEKDVTYKSTIPGVMHACGHDGHTATLLGVAKVLQKHRDELAGKLVLIFQHAEETPPGGAKEMIQAGCLKDVDAIFGAHLWSTIQYGTFGFNKGHIMAASDRIEIIIQGVGGHGSAPHQSVDAIAVASQIIAQLQLIVSRQIDPLKSAVVSIGTFHSGSAFNIIADSATLRGTVRTFNEEQSDLIERELTRLVENVCSAFQAKGIVNYNRGYPALYNHEKETREFKEIIDKDFGKDVAVMMSPQMGGEDFAHYVKEIPGMFFFTGAGNPEIGAKYPHHHPKFDFDERAMLMTGKAFLSIVHYYLGSHNGIQDCIQNLNAEYAAKDH